ncbi:MAG TPA: hypothetical protein VED63_10210 [Acidimicrobiales bacterium]|nr:hypothetical protein [Acidimicrobiales bacterium]
MNLTMRRWIAIGGLVFVVLIVLAVTLFSLPGTHGSAATVANSYAAHKSAVGVSAYLIAVAVLEGVFYFWYLRDLIGTAEATKRLATIGFAGALLFAGSGGLAGGLYWTAYDLVGHAPATTFQTLNAMQNDTVAFLLGPGVAIFLIATGAALIRSGVLPKWLGWLGLIAGVVAIVLPVALGPYAAGFWILVASIVMLVHNPVGRRAASLSSRA